MPRSLSPAPDAGRLALWGLRPGCDRPDIPLQGSPERCEARAAVQDSTGRVLVLERLGSGSVARRGRIGAFLLGLAQDGLPVPAPMADPDGRILIQDQGAYWQLSPFVPGDPLPQPDYVDQPERGIHLGRFLASLRRAGAGSRDFDGEPGFSLPGYIKTLMATIAQRQPDLHRELTPILAAATPLAEAWPDLETAPCHGDFHPGNVIWRGTGVAAVIDWEFAGHRPVLFDAANCLGCVGIEEPAALVRGLAPALLRTLRDEACLPPRALALLPEMILALRMAWLSEWLRRNDRAMIDLEVRFMRLLANSLDTLLPAWKTILEAGTGPVH
ncbi:phosphotransferase [Pseudodesulfovibrio sp. F-1]|uniref:Phosphotransferase n=1 Tax=Pseudodesulfovibrio alkaliphilus TaxID=2661613 RepID=A0A7K1KNR6_9BACT|nr:phosphotransferase [Pseudodesulfovibrio alkaliphilus]MUM77723.1 phosphotransferase [Pseudodesulfovibrio alkaliphilus]